MHWTDEAHLLSLRPHGETSVIAELMTKEHGRHFGLIQGGRSRKNQPLLQKGNTLAITWSARLEENLGSIRIEPLRLRTAQLTQTALTLKGLNLLLAWLRLLPERDPHPVLFEAATKVLDHLETEQGPALLARFELILLTETGFGLALDSCAVTGQTHDLTYVSPKSGRAVSREAGEAYKDRLLPLTPFLKDAAVQQYATLEQIQQAFRLTGFFLEHYWLEPQSVTMPQERLDYLYSLKY